jgi:hypothetical protein
MMWCSGNESLPVANNWSIVWQVRYQGYFEALVQPQQMRDMPSDSSACTMRRTALESPWFS